MNYDSLIGDMRLCVTGANLPDFEERIEKRDKLVRAEVEKILAALNRQRETAEDLRSSTAARGIIRRHEAMTAALNLEQTLQQAAVNFNYLAETTVLGEISIRPERTQRTYVTEVRAPAEGIKVSIENGIVFAKLPLVFSRKNMYVTAGTYRKVDYRHHGFYVKDLAETVKKAVGNSGFQRGNMAYKTVNFLYVYPPELRRNSFGTDNDAHDIKGFLDAVTGPFPGGDSPLTCSIQQVSVVTDEIPAGTYITVAGGSEAVIPSREVIEFWRKTEPD